MFKTYFFLLFTSILIAACQPKSTSLTGDTITLTGQWPEPSAALKLYKLGGGPALDTIAVDEAGQFRYALPAEGPLLGLLKGNQRSIALLLEPGHPVTLTPDESGQDINFDPADVANLLYRANNKSFMDGLSSRTGLLMRADPLAVRQLVDSLATAQQQEVDSRKDELSDDAYRLLSYEISRRKYDFLFNLGQSMRRLPAGHPFYDFVNDIDDADTLALAGNLGMTVLKKWDILFHRQNDTLGSNRQFFDYLQQQIPDEQLRAFYQSFYLKEILEGNSLFADHLAVMNISDIASLEYRLGKTGPYRSLYQRQLTRYYDTRQGSQAADFTALDTLGREVSLSDFDGKVIYIDTWASWCAPCLAELPHLQQLALDYSSKDDFVILTISFDHSFDRWLKALRKQPSFPNIIPLFVEGGMDSEYAETYLISSIPDYNLLDRERGIVTLEAPFPSKEEEVRRVIDGVLGE